MFASVVGSSLGSGHRITQGTDTQHAATRCHNVAITGPGSCMEYFNVFGKSVIQAVDNFTAAIAARVAASGHDNAEGGAWVPIGQDLVEVAVNSRKIARRTNSDSRIRVLPTFFDG